MWAAGNEETTVTARKGDILVYPPLRPDTPFVVIRFAGHGLHSAGVAKSEQAARAMLASNEEAVAKLAASLDKGKPTGGR